VASGDRRRDFYEIIEKCSMSSLPGLLIIAVFGVFAALMMSRRMPALLALPCMAVLIATISGAFFDWSSLAADAAEPRSFRSFLEMHVLTDGAAKLAKPMMYAVFGAILSQLVMRTGIAQRIVSVAAEYAGDRKMLLAGALTTVVAVCFTSVTGLGAVIMLGSLALPIMLGAGLSAEFSACLMLFAIALGGVFNPAILGFYTDTLKLDLETVKHFIKVYGGLLALTTLLFFLLEGRKERESFAWAVTVDEPPRAGSISMLALLTPILPIALIMFAKWEIIPAFLAGILYGALTTDASRALANITAATLEGLKDIGPVIGLFMGIGMALNAMSAEPTKTVMAPFLEAIIPTTSLGYLLFFTVLAPLALYRGPLNFFGLGAGIAGLLLGANLMPVVAIAAAYLAVGQIQGVCDPTNTSNVWLATFSKSSTERFLKRTLPYVWGFVAAGLTYAALGAGVMNR
jgi:DcuC family C4-dicarboxylate transporter